MKTQYIFLVIYTISLVSIASLINNLVRGPYMDEIFHIPQAQQYCKGEYYEWNPKLTTPPGLYITSNLIIKPLSFIFFNYINLCSTNFLRATNILFGIGLYKILRKLMINFHPFQDRNLISFNALTLSLFPVGWFFNFLYYTDSGSTFFVLWSYLLSIEKKYWMSALVGGISVLFRQSNIIWNCFILGTSLLAVLSDSNYDPKIKGMSYYRGINIRSDIVIKEIKDFLLLALKYFPRLFTIFFPYFLIFLSFFSFLIWNGGIVLGDKSNHTAVLHIPQIFYFISFTTIFSAPIILKFDYVDRLITGLFTLKFNRKNFFFVILAMIMIFIINQLTYEHKFLLSDNRHYTFYIWKNIYRRHYLVKYFLVPAYITAGWILLESIALQQSFLWILIYIAAVCLSLIPSPLLEFRYFIIPYYIFRINIGQPKNYTRLILEFLFYAIVNAQTVYIFLYEPFLWFSEINKWQRFMW